MQHSKLRHFLAVIAAVIGIATASALPANYYSSSSMLSQGRWVKVKVTNSGIQQITHSQLAQWGFNDPSKVTVHGFGGVTGANEYIGSDLPDDLPAQPVLYLNDKILFYGESGYRESMVYWEPNPDNPVAGIERNAFSDAGYYLITDSQTPVEIPTIPYIEPSAEEGVEAPQPENWHLSIVSYEEEADNPFMVGQNYYGRNILDTGDLQFNFNLADRSILSPWGTSVMFRLLMVGTGDQPQFSLTYPRNSSTTRKTITLAELGDHEYFTHNYMSSNLAYVTTTLPSTITKLSLKIAKGSLASMSFGALDNLTIVYPRLSRMGTNNQMLMTSNAIKAGTVKSIIESTEGTQVWCVDNAYNVRRYETVYDPAKATMQFTIDRDYAVEPGVVGWRAVAFNPTRTQNAVEYVGEVDNQDIHAMSTPDLIIVAADSFVKEANRLASIHNSLLSHNVIVLTPDDIYNEFSSGTPSAWGIRRMVKMFRDRDDSKMLNVLLFGGGTFDNRGLTQYSAINRANKVLLPTYEASDIELIRTGTKSYCGDAYFGITADTPAGAVMHQYLMDVNVGRIPATNLSDAGSAIDKIEEYLVNFPTVDFVHRAVVISDSGDDNSHLRNSEQIDSIFNEYAPATTMVKAYDSLYNLSKGDAVDLRAAVTQALKMGAGYFNYNGHANAIAFGSTDTWSSAYVKSTDYTFYPYAMLATCDAFDFDRNRQNIAEDMIFKSGGGMIGIVAATRTVYQVRNQVLNATVSIAYAQADNHTSTGDIFRIGRNEVFNMYPDNNEMKINTMCYGLCGDPALPLYASSEKISVTKINDTNYKSNGIYGLASLTPNTIKGRITVDSDPDSPTDTSFNGRVILTLYESPIVRETRVVGVTPSKSILTDEDVLGQFIANVVNGEFTIKFSPTVQTRQGDYNRMTLLAYNDNVEGTYPSIVKGHILNAFLNPALTPDESFDTEGPVISQLYIDDASFVSGDVVPGEFTAYAVVEPDRTGLLNATSTIGGAASFVIDDNRSIPVIGTSIETGIDGKSFISMPMNTFTDGNHTLTLNVSDNSGNTSSRTVAFTVINRPASAKLSADCKVGRTEVVFNLSHTFGSAPSGRLVIEDSRGHTVFTDADVDFSEPYTWDLTDLNYDPVEDGVYTAYAILKAGMQYASTDKSEIVVIREQ